MVSVTEEPERVPLTLTAEPDDPEFEVHPYALPVTWPPLDSVRFISTEKPL